MSILGLGTCLNRGCYNDVNDGGNYCCDECEAADKRKTEHDKQMKLKAKEVRMKKTFAFTDEPPECGRDGCHNKVQRRAGAWKVYCSEECLDLAHNFQNANGRKKVDRGEPPKCDNPSCSNPVKWGTTGWKVYCCQKCNRVANQALQRDLIVKEDWIEPEDLLRH